MDYLLTSNNKIPVKVAISEQDHQVGLMFRSDDTSMVFPYHDSKIRKFWMKNTPKPLDIIFCNNNRIIFIEHGKPFSEKFLGPEIPCDLVIELPFGQSNKIGLKINDLIQIKYSRKTKYKLYLETCKPIC